MTHRARAALGSALVVASALLAACAADSTSSTTTKKGRGATTSTTTTTSPFGVLRSIDSVQVGECFDQLPAAKQQPYAVLVIPCTELHTHEVFALTKYGSPKPPANGTAYPGDLIVSNNADEQCVGGFEAFVGIEWAASHYDIQSWWPTSESWTAKGDRNIVCTVTKVDGAHTKGSAAGIKD